MDTLFSLQDCKTMWNDIFGDTKAYTDHYFNDRCQNNSILTKYLTDTDSQTPFLAGMLHMNPYSLSFCKKSIDTYYIVGVATHPKHRHKGIMRSLLSDMFVHSYNFSIPFVYLMPASPDIYTPFDFTPICKQNLYTLGNTAFLSDLQPFFQLPDRQKADAVQFANTWLSNRYDVFVRRTINYYTTLALEMRACNGDILVKFDNNNNICGIYAYTNEESVELQDICGVLPEQSFLLPDDKQPMIMARVIDFLSLVPYMRSDTPFTEIISLKDDLISANNGLFQIYVDAENAYGIRLEHKKTPDRILSVSEVFSTYFPSLSFRIHEMV